MKIISISVLIWTAIGLSAYSILPHNRVGLIEVYVFFVFLAAIFSRRLNSDS
jgi:uncharacterized protein YktB (UPF0637 family)